MISSEPEANEATESVAPFFRRQRRVSAVGKFGWKGQSASLDQFVRDACANELGLEVPNAQQGRNPMQPSYRSPGLDLTSEELVSLVSFVEAIDRPTELMPTNENAAANARLGKEAFVSIGCAECHVENIGSSVDAIKGIYSDLLVHDMGRGLADPMPSGNGGGYYAISESNPTATRTVRTPSDKRRQEWRTPPLWGVSASAPYLHDGRASTLTEAIIHHGGEAKFSVKKYLQLPPVERVALIDFLNTLVPPGVDDI